MTRALLVCALALMALPAAAQPQRPSLDPDGPFGVAMGGPVEGIPGASPFKPGWYNLNPPPRSEPGLVRAAVEAFAGVGVCVVQGAGPTVADDADGSRIRAAMSALAQRYSALYGQPEMVDDCSGLTCAPEFWGADLQTGDRHHGYRWSLHDKPVHGVREVSLIAVAHSASAQVYLVQFDSADLTACHEAESALEP